MAFTERSYPFKRKQEGGDGFWRQKREIAESYVRGYHVYQRIWNPFVYTLKKLRDFASASHSYLLLEIFHTGTNEGIILIMRHIE